MVGRAPVRHQSQSGTLNNTMPAFSNLSAVAAAAQVPFQPGTTLHFDFAQKNMKFPRSTTLDFQNGSAVDRSRAPAQKRELGASRHTSQGGAWSAHSGPRSWTAPNTFAGAKPPTTKSSVASYLDQPKTLPAFVHLDKVALRFKCWFKDDLALLTGPDRLIIHKVVLTYYLIDDTISVMEPRQENSGLNQGCLLRRQNLVDPATGENYTWKDLTVGKDIEVRGQTYHIVDCDHYTRNWYAEQGTQLPAPLQPPLDPYEIREMQERKKRKDYEMAKQRRVQAEMMHTEEVKHRFLTYDRKVLRFYGVWDDRHHIFGQRHYVTIRFYLFDFTIDMQEREGSPTGQKSRFLVRQRIPRDFRNLDDMKRGADEGFLGLEDLVIGSVVPIFGKRIFVYDCDDFSRRYLEKVAGPVDAPVPISEPALPIPRLPTPPSNGLGSEEDSIQNCRMLRPKPARKDMAKYKKYAGKVMRFTARWDSERPEESCRTFIISYYPADDTLSIWETSGNGRNTGMASGKFLERMKLAKPGTSGSRIAYYQQADLYIGAVVTAQTRRFVLTSMDRFTSRLMDADDGPEVATTDDSSRSVEERLAERISRADALDIRDKCRIADRAKTSMLALEPLMEILADHLYGFSDKDIMTLVDAVRGDPSDYSGMIDYESFCTQFLGLDPDGGAAPPAPPHSRSAGGVGEAGSKDPGGTTLPAIVPPPAQASEEGSRLPMQEPIRPEGSRGGNSGRSGGSGGMVGGRMVGRPMGQSRDPQEEMGGSAWQPAATDSSFQWDEPDMGVGNDEPGREWVGGSTTQNSIGGGPQGRGGGGPEAVAEDGAEIEWASGNQYFD